MIDRRRFVLASSALATCVPARAMAAQECAVFTPARQAATTPDEALAMLKEGNERFVSGRTVNCDLRAQVRETAKGQAPFAAIVGCTDSRVPPELVFDQRIGDVSCARIAGNFINDDIIGSLEFSTRLAGAPLIVVLGHGECGAIKGAIDGAKLGYLTAMLRNFAPAIKAARAPGEPNVKNAAYVQAVADANAKIAASQLTARSEVLRTLVGQKKLRVVSAMHDIATGRVTFFA
jgi:carbonic anhydrase